MVKLKKVVQGTYDVIVNEERIGSLYMFLGTYRFTAPNGKVVKATTLKSAEKLIKVALD